MQIIDNLELMSRDQAVALRITAQEKRLLEKAAAGAKRKLADYVRLAALQQAEEDIASAEGRKREAGREKPQPKPPHSSG